MATFSIVYLAVCVIYIIINLDNIKAKVTPSLPLELHIVALPFILPIVIFYTLRLHIAKHFLLFIYKWWEKRITALESLSKEVWALGGPKFATREQKDRFWRIHRSMMFGANYLSWESDGKDWIRWKERRTTEERL